MGYGFSAQGFGVSRGLGSEGTGSTSTFWNLRVARSEAKSPSSKLKGSGRFKVLYGPVKCSIRFGGMSS